MGRIPPQLKKKVIQEWLQGFSRDSIALINNIGLGTVTGIVKQSRPKIPDIDLLREVALIIKKGNLDINHFTSSIRLKNMLDKLGLSEEMMEPLLEDIETHCFRGGLDINQFVSKIREVSKLVDNLGISISEIPSYINQKNEEIKNLESQWSDWHKIIMHVIYEYHTTKEDLEGFKSSRPLIDKINKLELELKAKDEKISLQRQKVLECQLENYMRDYSESILEKEFDKANELLSEEEESPIDMGELSRLSDEIYHYPSRNIDIIKLLRERQRPKLDN